MTSGESMRLRKRRGKQKYYTYEVTLPKRLVEALGWKEGMELEIRIYTADGKKGLLITPKNKSL